MGTLMQLLLEALRANVGNRNDELGHAEDQLTDEMSGFILENVHVATMPYIESEEDEEPPNPLLQLVRNRERPRRGSNPQNIHKILDHIVRLEKKVKVLERCIPPKTFQQRLWLAPTSVSDYNPSIADSDYYPGDDEEEQEAVDKRHSGSRKGSHNSNSKSPRHGSPKSEEKASRLATRPVRLEKEERSCFARLLFSRCWTGKDHAGWKIKRHCPTGAKGSLSCPCGQIGPCQKVKAHPVPIDKLKSTGPGNKKNTKGTASSGGSKNSRKMACSKNQETVENQKKNASSPQNAAKTNGKPFYEKLFPCCFRDHAHTECCCRCKDNPPLTDHKSKEEVKKSSVSKLASPKSSAEHASRKVNPGDDSGSPSQDTVDEDGSDFTDDQSQFTNYNIHTISNSSPKNREKINHLSRKHATGGARITSKRKDSRTKGPHRAKKEAKTNSSWPESNDPFPKPTKSTTSFQIMLHPDISNDRIVEPEVVSHQILKTLSTIHGPVKVEQKIVVQGTTNSVVIVTHGEACQCNLCNMLKGKMHPNELIGGLSPQVVKISTDSGFNTLISHSDGCHCELCRVLDPASTKNTEHRAPQLENQNLVMAACSASNENGSVEKSNPESTVQTLHSNGMEATVTVPQAEIDPPKNCVIGTRSLIKKSKWKTSGKKKATKCRCTKCRQRRRVEKLKRRLKKEMGTEEYNRVLREITCRDDGRDDRKTSKRERTSVQSDSDDSHYAEPRRVTKKFVSFSDEPDPKRQEDEEAPKRYGDSSERKRRCKWCKVVNMNAKEGNGIFRKDKDRIKSWHSQNHNSTVYSMNASSHEIPCECQAYGSPIPHENSDNHLRSKSKSSEKGVYRFKSEEQKCFPTGRKPKHSREKQASIEKKMKDKITEEFLFHQDTPQSPIQRGSSCSGRCREEVNRPGKENSAILLQEGAFPQKFVYWAPGSRSNMATAYSSESYYVPDQDEFPIVNMECDDSAPSSGGAPVHRAQIPIWFRMLPDRNAR